MKKIILLPGLGATADQFRKLNLPASDYEVRAIDYPVPDKEETLEKFAEKLAGVLPRDEKLIFIGVSFGGIIAQEMAKFISPEIIVLISSISSRHQIPFYLHFFKLIPVYKILPDQLLKRLILSISRAFTHKSREDRLFFESMVWESDVQFIRWGIEQTLRWQQIAPSATVIHIHGSKDRLFPIRRIKADFTIENGEHLIVVQRAGEVSDLLKRILNEYENIN